VKTISLWQPHPTYIMLGVKPYETRSWAPPRYLIGQRIAIHAAKSLEDLTELAEYLVDVKNGCDEEEGYEALLAPLRLAGFKSLGDLPRGCIIGSAILQSSVRTETLSNPGPFGDFSTGRFAWHMVDPIALPEPMLFRGKQGFFEVPDSVFEISAELA